MSHIYDAVNDFRRDNWGHSAEWAEWLEHKCFLHCSSMANQRILYHSPPEFRDFTWECCCASEVHFEERDQIRHMVFDLLGNSPSHRELLLIAHEFAGFYYVKDNIAYITIRGY